MARSRGQAVDEDSVMLPPCDGPKLHPFEHSKAKIKWMNRLDEDREGNQGYVFHVEIASKEYALKLVSGGQTEPKDS